MFICTSALDLDRNIEFIVLFRFVFLPNFMPLLNQIDFYVLSGRVKLSVTPANIEHQNFWPSRILRQPYNYLRYTLHSLRAIGKNTQYRSLMGTVIEASIWFDLLFVKRAAEHDPSSG